MMQPSSRVHFKVCCIASLAEARLAASAGASALGLVSAMPSGPGVIDEALIAEIAAAMPPTVDTFLLTAHQRADAIVAQHARCRTTVIQLVDALPPDELATLRAVLPRVKLVQVIHVLDEASIREALTIAPAVDALLLDSGNPREAVKELGGTGRVHNWGLSRRIVQASPVPVWLAGGLNPGNAAQALSAVQPHGLDVCSGLRKAGALDAATLHAFVAALRGH